MMIKVSLAAILSCLLLVDKLAAQEVNNWIGRYVCYKTSKNNLVALSNKKIFYELDLDRDLKTRNQYSPLKFAFNQIQLKDIKFVETSSGTVLPLKIYNSNIQTLKLIHLKENTEIVIQDSVDALSITGGLHSQQSKNLVPFVLKLEKPVNQGSQDQHLLFRLTVSEPTDKKSAQLVGSGLTCQKIILQ